MKNLLQTLKSARWVEMLMICALAAVLMILFSSETAGKPVDREERMENILSSIEGAGQVQVLQGEDNGGILILSEGAENVSVMLSLQRAVHTITGLSIEKIEIAKSR